jgi:hypothetical protein
MIRAAGLLVAILTTGCVASFTGSTAAPVASPGTAAPSSATAPSLAIDLIGSWHRAQSCQETLAAFDSAGLAESHADWLTGNFLGGSPAPSGGDICDGAPLAVEHSHFFTASGEFGSHDENGQQVDDGDYVLPSTGLVAFPSHATEFAFAGELVVGYQIDGDVVTFTVTLPDPCDESCKNAYAWALSAFASGPWSRGDVP